MPFSSVSEGQYSSLSSPFWCPNYQFFLCLKFNVPNFTLIWLLFNFTVIQWKFPPGGQKAKEQQKKANNKCSNEPKGEWKRRRISASIANEQKTGGNLEWCNKKCSNIWEAKRERIVRKSHGIPARDYAGIHHFWGVFCERIFISYVLIVFVPVFTCFFLRFNMTRMVQASLSQEMAVLEAHGLDLRVGLGVASGPLLFNHEKADGRRRRQTTNWGELDGPNSVGVIWC